MSVPQGAALGLLTGLGGGIVGLVTILIIAFYYLMEKSWIRHIVLLDAAPETRIRVSRIWDEVEQKVGDWLRGQMNLCLIVGVTATIGYAVIGVRFWPLLGLWDGVTRFIPILGPWLGAVPAVIIALTQGWHTASLVVAFILLLQVTENAMLLPRIMRGAVGLSPLTVTVSILAGTEVAGVVGALLAIPIAAVIQVLLSHYTEAQREAKLAEHAMLPGWRWMRGSVALPTFAAVAPGTGVADGREASREASNSAPGWSADVLSRAAGQHESSRSLASREPQHGERVS